jgi:hypothetical protein
MNKSGSAGNATKKRFSQAMGIEWALIAMTLQEAKSIARHLGLTMRKVRSGDYRVNFRDGNATTAYYTDSLEDAANTAVEMARKRGGASCTNVMTAAYALVEATNKCLAKSNKPDAERPLK